MLKAVLVVVAVLVVAVLAFAATRPDSLAVQRSVVVQAPAEKIMPHLVDLHRWAAWSPYEKKDPAMKRSFSGPPSGTGAEYAWDGNAQVGAGRMKITDVAPSSRVVIQLDFDKPIEGHNVAEFALQPDAGGTRVTWSIRGPTPYLGKLMGLVFDMDKMIGDDFAAGLAALKAVSEK